MSREVRGEIGINLLYTTIKLLAYNMLNQLLYVFEHVKP